MPPTVFVPKPKVDSVIVGMVRRSAPPVDVPGVDELFALVRSGFAQRRKMLRRSLQPVLGVRTIPVLDAAGVAPTGAPRRSGSTSGRRWRAARRSRHERGQAPMRLACVRATAYPKLTLSLRVTGVRDDGYHDLDALVISLGQPHDVLEAYAVPAPGGVRVEVDPDSPEGAGIPTDHTATSRSSPPRSSSCAPGVPATACASCSASASLRAPGLGGGSADAAAALLAVRRLLDVDVDDAGVLALAAEIGADVSFCVRGGAAWMRGRGEQLGAGRRCPPALAFLVAIPPFRLSTPDVYRAWDRLGGPVAARRVPPPRPLAPIVPELRNDLEPAAEALEPRLMEFRTALEAAAGRPAILAGSGSAYVVPVNAARSCRSWSKRSAAACTCPSSARRASRAACGSRPEPDRAVAAAQTSAPRAARSGQRPCWRRCQRVFLRSFLCFFFRMRLRRVLFSEPHGGA